MGDSEYLSKEDWFEIAQKYLGKDVAAVTYNVTPLKAVGGYIGEHYVATVSVSHRGFGKELRFFVKGKPRRFPFQVVLDEKTGMCKVEALALGILFPEFKSSLKNNGKGLEWTCECFFVKEDVIVLEDLADQGFRLLDNRGPIKYKQMEMVLTKIANMHSASLIYEENHRKKPFCLLSKYPELETSGFFRPGEPGTTWLKSCVSAVWALVELIYGKEKLNQLKADIEKMLNKMFVLQTPSTVFRNVVGQGDMKRENFLFRHEDGELVDMHIIDYQTIRYMPPANDVMCLLHISSNRKFREQFTEKLLKHYHEHLSQNLRDHGLEPEKILSWIEFQKSCEVYKELGVIMGSLYSPYTFMNHDRLDDVFSSNESLEQFLLKDRVPDIINSFNSDEVFRTELTYVIEELLEYMEKSKI